MARKSVLVLAASLALAIGLLLPVVGLDNVRSTYLNEISSKIAVYRQPAIVVTGDSLAAGGTPWFIKLGKAPFSVVTVAKGGLTSEQLLPVVQGAAKLHPHILAINAGTNDVGMRNYNEDQSVSDVLQLVDVAAQSGAKVIFTLPPPVDDPQRSKATYNLATRLLPLLRQRNVSTVNLWDEMAPNGTLRKDLSLDGIHFTPNGYEVWAKHLKSQI